MRALLFRERRKVLPFPGCRPAAGFRTFYTKARVFTKEGFGENIPTPGDDSGGGFNDRRCVFRGEEEKGEVSLNISGLFYRSIVEWSHHLSLRRIV